MFYFWFWYLVIAFEISDEIIIVTAKRDILIERLCQRDGIDYDEAVNALSIRMTESELIELSKAHTFEPYIIDNSADLYSLQYYTDKTIKKILED